VFKLDDEYVNNEEKYATLRKQILDFSDGEEGEDDEDVEEGDEEDQAKDTIFDKTETNLVSLFEFCIVVFVVTGHSGHPSAISSIKYFFFRPLSGAPYI